MTPAMRRWVTTGFVVATLVLAYAVLLLTGRDRWWGGALGTALVLATVPVVAHRARAVLRSSQPFQEAVAAVAVVSTLVVVGTAAAVYVAMAAETGEFEGLVSKIDAIYFTMAIVSTVGFGDVRPVGQAARLVTTLHIVFTIVVAGGSLRLLTWAARRRLADRDADPV